MNSRNCGTCTACCDGWLSSEHIDMAPWKPCRHRTDTGCAIYAERPEQPCRTFQCAWVEADSALAEDMRPDRCGVIVVNNRSYQQWKIILATPTGWRIPDDALRNVKAYAQQQRTPLIYIENLGNDGVYSHFSRSGFGPRDFIDAVTRGGDASGLRDM